MIDLRGYFEEGLANPYRFTPDGEALCEACRAVGVFMNASSPVFARMTVLTNAGSCVGGMTKSRAKDMITDILWRCCDLQDGEAIRLTPDEDRFITHGMAGHLG